MKKIKLFLTFFVIISCSPSNEISTQELDTTTSTSSTTSTTTTTSTTVLENPLIVQSFEDLPMALVRIEVKSTQAELNENFEIEIFEYDGTGSGFFISDNGYIVTNNHVVSGAVTIEVYTQYRSQPYTAKLIGLSECDDLAILKIEIEDAKYLVLDNSEPKLGQNILAAGFPLGDEEVTFLDGIISKKQTNGSTSWASIEYAFEHTAEILPGSSGGPIVNEDVRVIGIAYAGNEDRQEFGIPIAVVSEKIEQLINNEFEYSFKANMEQFYGGGLYLYSVDSNSPFRDVGLKGGELITEIKGLSLLEETTLKVYCDALFTRNTDIGITFSGISLEDLEEFEVEVSLDGSVKTEISRNSIFTSKSGQSTPTTTVPVTNTTVKKSPKYIYDIPELVNLETYKISDSLWEVKIYLNYLKDDSGLDDGFESISHCLVELLAPPYFDDKDDIGFKAGQVKRQENCSSERTSSNELVVTHRFNYAFDWTKLYYSEIPIISVVLYPTYDLSDQDTYNFYVNFNFGFGRACGYHETTTGNNYSPDCHDDMNNSNALDYVNTIINNKNLVIASNTNSYKWNSNERYYEFTLPNSNNFCDYLYRDYGWKHLWKLDSNSVCIKR